MHPQIVVGDMNKDSEHFVELIELIGLVFKARKESRVNDKEVGSMLTLIFSEDISRDAMDLIRFICTHGDMSSLSNRFVIQVNPQSHCYA